MKYTALEIVTKTGIENPEAVFGTKSVDIGGIVVNTPDHIIDAQDSEHVTVTIGTEVFKAALPEEDPLDVSPAVKEIVASEVAEAEKAEEAVAETPAEEVKPTE